MFRKQHTLTRVGDQLIAERLLRDHGAEVVARTFLTRFRAERHP
jgi:hypothetical protein